MMMIIVIIMAMIIIMARDNDITIQKITRNIIVVDDDADIITIIERYLEKINKNGFIIAVKGFTDPTLALAYFKEHSKDFDIVISDIRMPKMTGFQFVREIKAVNPEVKVFLMTSFEINKSEFDKVLPSIKVEDFIQKPISSMKALADVIIIFESKNSSSSSNQNHHHDDNNNNYNRFL